MPAALAPWWMFILAVSYVAYLGLLLHADTHRLEQLGFLVSFEADRMRVDEVPENSAAARQGLRAGDEILAAGGLPIRTRHDWVVFEQNQVLGRPVQLLVEREQQQVTIAVTPGRAPPGFFRTPAGTVLLAVRATQVVTLGIAFLVAFKRPDDRLARLGAWLLASGAVYCIALPVGMAATWRDLPAPLGALLWLPFVSSIAIGGILFTFFASFPRPLITSRWLWAAAWGPMVGVTTAFVSSFALVVYRPGRLTSAPDTTALMITGAIYAFAGLSALLANYAGLRDVNERRRVRLILPGSAAALLSNIALVALYLFRPPADETGPIFASPYIAVGAIVLLALPISFAYAILRRRLFGVSMLLRQGVRYALARRFVLSLVPLVILVMAMDLVLQRDRPLGDVLAIRSTIYAGLIGLTLFVAWRRDGWLARLDRRFFRERYDAHRLLRRVTAGLREAGTLGRAAPLLVAQIEAALHPQFAALMLKRSGSISFETLASAPSGAAPLPIPSDWKVLSLARVLSAPLLLSPDGDDYLTRHLPPNERAYVRQAGVEVLLAVPNAGGSTEELMLALGPKRSEEPYAPDDLDLLAGTADALALVLQRPGHDTPPGAGLEECPACGRCYDSGTGRCAHEQHALEHAPTDRVLARRYRLERRLGEGGMGKVYEAKDTALDRLVAVKILKDERIAAGRASERFQAEARIAAGFSHPNVVTIHDFGIGGGRAFLVMELLRGKTLREELRARRRLSPRAAVEVLRGVCAAVEAAHARSLIHRDLKPENIFLIDAEPPFAVKVLDFGLARSIADGGADGFSTGNLVQGTPPYMAPEQLRGESACDGWDTWSLSVIAYELVTGALPFTTASGLVAHAVGSLPTAAAGWPDPIAARLGGGLEPLQPLFASALSIDARNRLPSVRSLLTAFESAAADVTP